MTSRVRPARYWPAGLLAKLNLRDRVQAVVFACENGLVRPGGTNLAR